MSNFGYGNQLSFPSYNQNQIPQRNINGLNNIQNDPTRVNEPQPHHHQHHHQPPPQPPQQQQQQPPTDEKPIKKERKNRPGQKFGAKKKSWVWSWFIQDSHDPNVAACDYCGRIITRLPSDKGSPKKLSEHLKTHKLTKDSINNSRPIPIDGNGITYTHNGMPLSIPTGYSPPGNENPQLGPPQRQSPVEEKPDELDDDGRKRRKTHKLLKPINNFEQSQQLGFNSGRRYLSTNFDNAPYSPMKFHKHIMKFLTENKLSIGVIKSHSFQQLVYDLRSDSIADLLELAGLYSTLLEVSRFDAGPQQDPETAISEANVVNTINKELNKKD